MASVFSVRAIWSGFQGAPGYSNFRFTGLGTDAANNAAGAAVRTFFGAMSANFLTGWTITVQSEVTEWDVQTGLLVGVSTMTTPPSPVGGSATITQYAGGSGLAISWHTNTIFAGRRVQGRTFIVPVVGVFETDGTLTTGAIASMKAAGDALIASGPGDFSIWAKTFSVVTPPAKPVQIGGATASVTSCTVKDMASQLRTRRT